MNKISLKKGERERGKWEEKKRKREKRLGMIVLFSNLLPHKRQKNCEKIGRMYFVLTWSEIDHWMPWLIKRRGKGRIGRGDKRGGKEKVRRRRRRRGWKAAKDESQLKQYA